MNPDPSNGPYIMRFPCPPHGELGQDLGDENTTFKSAMSCIPENVNATYCNDLKDQQLIVRSFMFFQHEGLFHLFFFIKIVYIV